MEMGRFFFRAEDAVSSNQAFEVVDFDIGRFVFRFESVAVLANPAADGVVVDQDEFPALMANVVAYFIFAMQHLRINAAALYLLLRWGGGDNRGEPVTNPRLALFLFLRP